MYCFSSDILCGPYYPINSKKKKKKMDGLNFGVYVNYFTSLHYEMFIIDNVAINWLITR